jgi:RNA polymerase sigma-70 factor, ECF subfamily
MATGREELRRRLQRVAARDPRLEAHVAAAEDLAWLRVASVDAASVDAESMDLEALLLSVAAASGDSAAIADFEARYFGAARAALRSMGISSDLQADALSRTREALFVAPAKEVDGPRILELVGKGDLSALVKVVAVRRALNLKRAERGHVADSEEALVDVIADQTSPEWGALASEHRGLVKEAFGAALADLDAEARTMLRLSVIHGLSIDDLGAMHNTHRSTAARRLAKIRDTLRSAVRARLQERLGSSPRELESMLRAAQSGLDISFERLLAPDDA